MSAAISCTSCNRPLRVPESALGQMVQCPLCLDEFLAQADPAAEAAARAAEPPARRTAPKPELVAANGPEDELPLIVAAAEDDDYAPVWVEPVAETAAPKKAGRKTDEERSFAFPVLVTRDPDRVLRGRMEAELTDRGLHLRKPRQPPAFAAVGGQARYLGANRLVVTIEGRQVELVIDKSWTSTYHLAKDVAGFLNGQREFPDRRTYNVPWVLYFLPVLFVALPFAAGPFGLITDGCLGVFLWCVIAAVLAGVSLLVVVQARLTPRARLIGAGGLLALGAAIYLISFPLTPAYTVDASLWKAYTSPDNDFSVLVPGMPVASPVAGVVGANKFTTAIQSPDISFTVYVAPAPPLDNNPIVIQPFNNNARAVDDAKKLLNQEFSLGFQYAQTDRDMNQYSGQLYHELFYQVPTGSYAGPSAGKSLAARIYVVNGTTYTLAVFGPKVRGDGPDVIKFYNSFRIKASANPKPALPPGQPAQPAGRQPASPKDMNGLLAYWSFDNVQGNQVDDESGNLLTGTLYQATVINDGARGQAIHINGQGSYFDFSNANNLNFQAGDDFTYCGWVRTRAVQGVVVSNRQDQSGAPEIDVKLENGALAVEVRQDGNDRIPGASFRGPAVNDGAWHHFALTRSHGLVAADVVSLYDDGVRKGSQLNLNAGGAVTTDLRALGAELYLRRHGPVGGNTNYTGDVDEFCVFNRVLNEGEIRQLAGVAGP